MRLERVPQLLHKGTETWSSWTVGPWKMGLENLLKAEASTSFYFLVSLCLHLEMQCSLLWGAVKINYLTYTNYYECAPCNFLINQNASSFHLGQCTVFRGYGIHYTNTKTDKETFVFIPQKPYPEF